MKIRTWAALAAFGLPLLFTACGGGGGSDGGDGALRLVNAAEGYASLDLYSTDTLISSAVTSDSAGSYVSLGAGTYTLKLKRNGSTTTSNSTDRSVAKDTAYTLLAYTTAETLKTVLLTEGEEAPSSGTAKLRVFNASTEAGTLDVYVTAPDAALSDSSATTAALGTERIGSYAEISAGTYRIRVTGSGDKTDLRLDLPSVTLADQQVTTLVLTATPGGVLVHGLSIDQKSDVTARKNPSARVRLVAGANANGSVAATANGVTLSAGLQSPAVGGYALVPAGDLALDVSLNGNSVASTATTLAAGSDSTLLVTGDAGSAVATLLNDDNRPALSSSNAKLRLVHGIGSLASPITLTADYSAVASDVARNTASAGTGVAAGTSIRLEASTPTAGTLYLADDVTLLATRVYTVFMLGDSSAPLGVLRRDR
ncbi:MAG: DUF4397 domain-containing protein [Piscinibacter sp.]|nr:DUF4397 domain-containing protein [Piscinibacter sp.]